jgi:vanillate O-demethylase monooxygenase subunit
MFPAVVDQDRWALERQQHMMEFPDNGYSELFLRSDKALRRARQILAQMQHEEAKAAATRPLARMDAQAPQAAE